MSLTGNAPLTTAAPLTNDGFWPDISMSGLLDNYRIPSEYADGVIKTGLTLAMIRVNDQLKTVKKAIQDLGYNSLADYIAANPESIGGQDVLTLQYENAIYARAKAGLLKNFATIDRREKAVNEAKESPETEQYWLNESQASIKAFFDKFLPEETTLSRANTHVVLL